MGIKFQKFSLISFSKSDNPSAYKLLPLNKKLYLVVKEWKFLFKNLSFFLEQPANNIATNKNRKIFNNDFFNI